jgi:hypothetical protein
VVDRLYQQIDARLLVVALMIGKQVAYGIATVTIITLVISLSFPNEG